MKTIKPNLSVHYMFISVISIALSNFFAKLSMGSVGIYMTTFQRFFIPFILLSIISLIFKRYKQFNFENIKYHLIRSIALTASQFFLFFSMLGLPMSEATVLYNTGPIFIVLCSLCLGVKINLRGLLSLFLGTLGVLLICQIQNAVINRYVVFGLLSGFAFCISQMTLQKTSKMEDSLTTMFFLYGLTSIFSFVILLVFYKSPLYFHSLNIDTYLFLLVLGLSSVSNQFFRGMAYKESVSPEKLAPILYFSVFISAFLDFVFFHIVPDDEIIFGGSLVLIGSYITVMKRELRFFYFKIIGEGNV